MGLATKKYPAAILVSEHPNKPNVFKAPRMVHLSLNGTPPPAAPAKEVKPLKKAKKVVKKAKKVVKKAKKVVKAKKAVKKVTKAKIVKAAAKAKAKAGKV